MHSVRMFRASTSFLSTSSTVRKIRARMTVSSVKAAAPSTISTKISTSDMSASPPASAASSAGPFIVRNVSRLIRAAPSRGALITIARGYRRNDRGDASKSFGSNRSSADRYTPSLSPMAGSIASEYAVLMSDAIAAHPPPSGFARSFAVSTNASFTLASTVSIVSSPRTTSVPNASPASAAACISLSNTARRTVPGGWSSVTFSHRAGHCSTTTDPRDPASPYDRTIEDALAIE
mmetsp:Transcript_22572/g.45697  ORF Transcript_22572/g.45697 Transcript_22572/m.45697 type:complete len:235 (+) Transcript_22572:346-1050(+)